MGLKRFLATATLNIWFYFWFPIVLCVSVVFAALELVVWRVFKPSFVRRALRRSVNRYGRVVALTAWPWIKVKVLDAPPPDEGPYVVVENHTSSFDPFVQGFLPYELVQAARGWALHLPVLGFVGRLAGYLDVDALSGDVLVKRAVERLRDGITVVFFPEGTRHPEGNLGPFHGTAFRVALSANVPIAPAVVTGIADKPRKGSLVMRPGVITIKFLPLITPDEWKGDSVSALKKRVRAALSNALPGDGE